MDSFIVCIEAVTPIVLLMIAGYICNHFGIVSRQDVIRVNKIAFTVFLSAMVFNSIYTSEFSQSFKPALLGYAGVSIVVIFVLSLLISNLIAKKRFQKGVITQGLFRSNFVMIGIQFASSLVPNGGMGAVAMLCVIIIPLYNILAVIVLSIYGSDKVSWGQTFLRILKNPLIIATILAIIVVFFDIKLPAPIEKTVSLTAGVATPLMLFLLGAFFQFDSLPVYKKELAVVCFFRLLVFPAIVLCVGVALGFGGVDLVALIAVFGSATAVASFTMAQQMGGDGELAADIVVATSMLCPVTLFLFSFICLSFGLV